MSEMIINRRIIREASLRFLSSIEALKGDKELLEATADDLTSVMVKAMLLSLETDDSAQEQESTLEKEKPSIQKVMPDEEEVMRRSEQMRTTFLAKLQQRVKPNKE